jgi:2-succinyl-5-enolpyruvyl-6-hydroxy-3-cyclohexene-1-carboxylate synthase
MHPFGRMVIVAGRDERDQAAGEELARFAAQARIPVLADPLSGARRGPSAIAHYDAILRDPVFAATHRPQFVIRVGDVPTSKPLRAWLSDLDDVAQIAIDPDDTWQDPDSVVGMRVSASYRTLLSGLAAGDVVPAPDEWLAAWRAADDAADRAIADVLAGEAVLSEPLVARSLGEWLPTDSTLFVASSMPIRDVESFLAVRADGPRVLSNRGANGIDGTVSAAFGAAAAGARSVVLLIGDVALAHDIGGLLAARRLGLSLTIVLLNNDGGGIFHFLPVAGERDAFEEHVATPHDLDFSHAAELYGFAYARPGSTRELRAAVERSLTDADTTLIEILTDREDNLALHRRLQEAVRAALIPRAEAAAPRA